jgi:hypothetical protein
MKLTIRSVGERDLGTYRCTSKNPLGEIDGTIQVYGKQIFCDFFFTPNAQVSRLIRQNYRHILIKVIQQLHSLPLWLHLNHISLSPTSLQSFYNFILPSVWILTPYQILKALFGFIFKIIATNFRSKRNTKNGSKFYLAYNATPFAMIHNIASQQWSWAYFVEQNRREKKTSYYGPCFCDVTQW